MSHLSFIIRHRSRRHAAAGFIAAALFILTGCTVGPDYAPPRTESPSAWAGAAGGAATQPSVATADAVKIAAWWQTLGDAKLTDLIERAMNSNLDLRLAEARLRQARAARGVVAAGLWPAVDASASYSRSKSPGRSSRDLFQIGLDAAWELDVFGGTRRGVEAAEADIQAAEEDQRDVWVILAAEVALNYVDLRGLQQQLAVARQNLDAQDHTAQLTRKLNQAGFANGLDVANAEAQVASTKSVIPLLEAAEQQAIYNLSVLLGREPSALRRELADAAPIPATPPVVPAGLPSDVLRRRPDIRRAEAQLHAATARVGVATADLFPKFSLTGSMGLQADKFVSLDQWANRFWSIGPTASWPVFDAGRIRAGIRAQDALQEQALLAYEKTVLTAFQEVESALMAYAKEQEHRQSLIAAVAANRRAVTLVTQLYSQGQVDFLNVLSAQRSLFGAEDALVQSDRNVTADLIALYKALGGGWEVLTVRVGGPVAAPTTAPASQPAGD